MAIIKTYPLKNNYYGPDRLILSDMQPDDQGVVHGTTKSLTLSSLKSFLGANAVLNLTTQNTSGAATYDANTNTLNIPVYTADTNTTYDLTVPPTPVGSDPVIRLTGSDTTQDDVSVSGSGGITVTGFNNNLNIDGSGISSGVSSITNAFGTYITGTANAAATGAVNLGTINLSAIDGTSIATTRFLSKDNTWDVISASGSTGSVQFKASTGGFQGDTSFIFESSNDKLIVGDTSNDNSGTIEIQSDENGGTLKIGGGSQTYYTSIKGSDSDTADYNIILPPAGPGGNNKILESTSAGILSWIDTPVTSTPAFSPVPIGMGAVATPISTLQTYLAQWYSTVKMSPTRIRLFFPNANGEDISIGLYKATLDPLNGNLYASIINHDIGTTNGSQLITLTQESGQTDIQVGQAISMVISIKGGGGGDTLLTANGVLNTALAQFSTTQSFVSSDFPSNISSFTTGFGTTKVRPAFFLY